VNSKKILIIDDEMRDIKAMTVVLERAGYSNIFSSETEEDGIKKVMSLKPDVVLIDVLLKNTNGFDVCKKIRDIPGSQNKIIMITGHLDAVDANKATHSGAEEIIEKTLGYTNLVPAINAILKK